MSLPTIMTTAGLTPQTTTSLRSQLLASVAAEQPGYSANLPGSLVEDISSTDVLAISLCDSARVETVNSLTPYGCNAFILNQLGQIYGVSLAAASTTSVYVVFTGTPGFPLPVGFTVSDGTYQYTLTDGGVIGAAPSGSSVGVSASLYAIAAVAGSWAVAENTVTNIITSVPTSITLSVTNPLAGTPATSAETEEDYRSAVLQAGLASSQGMTTTLKTALKNVTNVQSRLVSVRYKTAGWEILCGGGDPYSVANAIFQSIFDPTTIVGSTISVTAATQASPCVITTDLNHGYSTGNSVTITGALGMTAINGTWTATVIDEKNFSIAVNTSASAAYTLGGVCTPNSRNQTVAIYDAPDTYNYTFVVPPLQTVAIAVTWNTTSTNTVSNSAVSQLAIPALVSYVNSIAVGQSMNLFDIQDTFRTAASTVISTSLITRMVFSVSINGVGVSPTSGTGLISGDPESYFETSSASITVTQG